MAKRSGSRSPFIRFLFMECMLLGAYVRQNDAKYRNHFSWWYPIVTALLLVGYFASKLVFSRKAELASLQILNQFVIFALLFFLLKTFAGLDEKLEKTPKALKKILSFLASITLEIYVVQYVLIDLIRDLNLMFPINWLCLTALILVSAFVLHFVCQWIIRGVDWCIDKCRRSKKERAV